MPVTPELDAEEQKLFDEMRGNSGADASAAAAEKAAVGEAAAAKQAAEKQAADKVAGDKAAADKAADKGADKAKPPELVPHEALKEARAENRLLRKEVEELKQTMTKGDANLQKLLKAVEKAEAAPAPKYEDDAAGHLKHKTDALEQENAGLKKAVDEVNAKFAKQDENAQAGDKMQRFAAMVTSKEQAFAKENPDYFKAADFVAAVWKDEFLEAGWNAEEIPQMVFQKSLAITNQAVQKEKDPAETIYKLAKRYGFASKPPEDKPGDKKAETKSDGETKLEALKRGQEAAKTNGGGSGPDDLSLSALAELDDDAIDKLVADKDWWSKNIRRSPLH